MDEALLCKIKNTLLVILKTREEPAAVVVLGVTSRWEIVPISSDYRDDDESWGARLFLQAEAYARLRFDDRTRIEGIIGETLNEITRSLGNHFSWVQIGPQLVDELSETQTDLVQWVREAWPKQLERENARDEDDIPF
jgi:hypothetical protein